MINIESLINQEGETSDLGQLFYSISNDDTLFDRAKKGFITSSDNKWLLLVMLLWSVFN